MLQYYPDEGLIPWLERMTLDDIFYGLYENNFTPDRDTVMGDLTEVSTFGYARQSFSGPWPNLVVSVHLGIATAPPLAFVPAGGDWTIYGYFVTDTAGVLLLAVARFDGAPRTILDGTPQYIFPKLSIFSRPGT